MRTKEVEEAIKVLDKYKIRLLQTRKEIGLVEDFKNHHTEKQYNRCGKRANAIDTVLSYIETLEKLPNKIRDKIKELEELWQEFNEDYYSDGCNRCEYQIELLKELIDDKSKNVWVD